MTDVGEVLADLGDIPGETVPRNIAFDFKEKDEFYRRCAKDREVAAVEPEEEPD